jgi:hypothetical protein
MDASSWQILRSMSALHRVLCSSPTAHPELTARPGLDRAHFVLGGRSLHPSNTSLLNMSFSMAVYRRDRLWSELSIQGSSATEEM